MKYQEIKRANVSINVNSLKYELFNELKEKLKNFSKGKLRGEEISLYPGLKVVDVNRGEREGKWKVLPASLEVEKTEITINKNVSLALKHLLKGDLLSEEDFNKALSIYANSALTHFLYESGYIFLEEADYGQK